MIAGATTGQGPPASSGTPKSACRTDCGPDLDLCFAPRIHTQSGSSRCTWLSIKNIVRHSAVFKFCRASRRDTGGVVCQAFSRSERFNAVILVYLY